MGKHVQPGQRSKNARPSRGRPPLDDSDRQRILDATAAVFLEYGYQRASTAEIARRAQTSKQTLYALFPAKQDLFAAVMRSHTDRLFARHAYFIASDKPPAHALAEMGRMALGLFRTPGFLALYRIVIAEVHLFPALARYLWDACLVRGYSLLAEYLRSRRIGGPDYRRSARQFITFILGEFVLNVLLNPDLALSDRALRTRVRRAVDDFLQLHPPRLPGKRR